MDITEFKETQLDMKFSNPEACIQQIKKAGIITSSIKLYENENSMGVIYYTLFKTPETLKKPGTAGFKSKLYTIEDTTFEELKARHYAAADRALEKLGRGQNNFIAFFGFSEPKPYIKNLSSISGIQTQKLGKPNTRVPYL